MKTKNLKGARDRRRAIDAVATLPPIEIIAQAEAYIPLAYRPHFHRALKRRAESFKGSSLRSDQAVEAAVH
jgi:hypothetical protein